MWRRRKKRTNRGPQLIVPVVSAAVAGATVGYLFDPERGRSRRARMRDEMAGKVRHSVRRTGHTARSVRAQCMGLSRRAMHAVHPPAKGVVDDVTLAHRVESEVYRDNHIPKGAINISAFEGTVTVRGALKHEDTIRDINAKVGRVPGVRHVESLLHLEGTPAPNKEEALEASHHVQGP